MFIHPQVLVCLASVNYVSAAFFNFGIPVQRPEFLEVSGDTVWVEAPADANSFPKFSKHTSESTDGETLTDFCDFVIKNGKLPWAVPESSAEYVPMVGQDARLPRFPAIDVIVEFCETMQQHNGKFLVPKSRIH